MEHSMGFFLNYFFRPFGMGNISKELIFLLRISERVFCRNALFLFRW